MIKKTLLIAGLSLFTTMGANAIGVSKIEPLNWFVGLKKLGVTIETNYCVGFNLWYMAKTWLRTTKLVLTIPA